MIDCEWHLYGKAGDDTICLQFPSWQMVIDRVVPFAHSRVPDYQLAILRHEIALARPNMVWLLYCDDNCVFRLRPVRKHTPMEFQTIIQNNVEEDAPEHAPCGASSAYRWMPCPGSIRLIEDLKEHQPHLLPGPSYFAMDGSIAHKLAQLALESGQDAIVYIDRQLHLHNRQTGEITYSQHVNEDMAVAVQVWLDECRQHRHLIYQIESRLSMRKLNPPVNMYGTADFWALDIPNRTIYIYDYKHGRGVTIYAEDNPQAKYYAVLVLANLPEEIPFPEHVVIKIVQPRGQGENPIKSVTYKAKDLLIWARDELLPAAARTQDPEAPFVAGDHCRFCPAKGVCAAAARFSIEQAGVIDFDPDTENLPAVMEKRLLDPISIPVADLARARLYFDYVRDWMRRVDDVLKTYIMNGHDVTLWDLEHKEGKRRWINEDKTVDVLKSLGCNEDMLYTKKMLSPKTAEDLLYRQLRELKTPAKMAQALASRTVNDLATRPEIAPGLVPKGSKHPVLPRGQDTFDADSLENVEL
jgi:hypothetical protein